MNTTTIDDDCKAQRQACADTILAQLGGHRFVVMTGAKGFVNDGGTLKFTLPGGTFCKEGINRVSITLEDTDTYRMIFTRATGTRSIRHVYFPVSNVGNVYAENLQEVFTEHTGLATHL